MPTLSSGTIHQIPADLKSAIAAASPKIRALWEDITPLARNEWICWVTDAKKSETRLIRIEKAISKPIDSAYLEAEKGGELRAVEEFNKDIEQMPKMPPRDSGSRLKKLLLTSTIGLIGATHTPQIEQATKRAAIVAEDTINKENQDYIEEFRRSDIIKEIFLSCRLSVCNYSNELILDQFKNRNSFPISYDDAQGIRVSRVR